MRNTLAPLCIKSAKKPGCSPRGCTVALDGGLRWEDVTRRNDHNPEVKADNYLDGRNSFTIIALQRSDQMGTKI